MSLAFLTGLAVGAALTLLYTKREEVKKFVNSPDFQDNLQKGKDFSQKTFNNIKDKFEELSPKIKNSTKEFFDKFKESTTNEPSQKAPMPSKPKTSKSTTQQSQSKAKATSNTKPATKPRTTTTKAK